ncbi:hypothetical protein F4677DRAFT_436394 [Hypoxylon crocopeplum]|nr:hypothetical protein F4677DRAFT_436394 [Hypoxylon crocopeplum]
MFESAVGGLVAILDRYPWVSELAGILPLSALIDFIDVPARLHIFQLSGSTPLWSSPITPAGSRLLLSDDSSLDQSCHLDRHGNSISLLGLDGRYGGKYYISSPETIRLCVGSHRPCMIDNLHNNMNGDDLRLQNLEIVHVSRLQNHTRHQLSPSWLRRVFVQSPWLSSVHYLAVSIFGWVILLAMIVMSIILQTYLSLAFLILMPLTGIVVLALYGINPRGLLVDSSSDFNRLILVAEHENTMNWTVFYGESTVLNSLLNRPLKPLGRQPTHTALLRIVLRIFILGQWALAIGSSAVKDWDAYFITFWIAFCIFVQAYIIPAEREAKQWMKSYAGIEIQRYQTQLSSRRALLNTVMALNPDTFALSPGAQEEDRTKLYDGAMRWIDPILEQGPSRTRWEEATLKAMNEAAKKYTPEDTQGENSNIAGSPSTEWEQEYRRDYWAPFIIEGIYMARKIREEANLSGRYVGDTKPSRV